MNINKRFYRFLLFLNVFSFAVNIVHSQNVGTTAYIEVNEIYLPFNNSGIIADVNVPPNGSGGQFSVGTFLYSSGFWLSGYTNDSLWANAVATASLVEDYQPGTVGMDPSEPNAAIYKLSINDVPFGQSWQDWIDAVNLGAAFYDGDGNEEYNPVDLNNNGVWDPDEDKPDILGDETYWSVFNDGVPSDNRRWGSDPQGIEIRQTIFGYNTNQLPNSNVVYIRYRIKNTGSVADTLKDVYFGVWADPDIGDYGDDVGGVDTTRNTSYGYNNTPDAIYGNQVPVFMSDQLSGPRAYIPDETFIDNNGNNIFEDGIDTPLDTAISMRGPLGIGIFPGAKNLEVDAAITYFNSDPVLGDPSTMQKARWYMQGRDLNGDVIDPCTFPYGEVRGGVSCNEVNPYFWFSGDPVTDVGWISQVNLDIRFLQKSGPLSLAVGEEVEIMVAYIVGQGSSPLGSISVAKNISDQTQDFFNLNFGYPIVSVEDEGPIFPTEFSLSQNYPNPFNPTTKIKYAISKRQYATLKVYDVLGNEIAILVNKEKPAGNYEVEFSAKGGSASGGDAWNLTSGIYFYQLRAGNFVETKKMVLLR